MAKKKPESASLNDVLAAIQGLTQVVGVLVQQKAEPVVSKKENDPTTVSVKKRGRPKTHKENPSAGKKVCSPTLPFKQRMNLFDEMPEKEAFIEEIDKKKWKPTPKGKKRQLSVNCATCGKVDSIRPDAMPPNQVYKCNNCIGKK